MMRVKVPGGFLTAAQAREIGVAADAFGEGPDGTESRCSAPATPTSPPARPCRSTGCASRTSPGSGGGSPRSGSPRSRRAATRPATCCAARCPGVDADEAFDALPDRPGRLGLLHRQPRVRQPAPQVQDVGVGLRRGLRPGRDQRHRPVAGPGRRRLARLQPAGRRRPVRRRADGLGHRRLRRPRTRRSRSPGPSPSSSASSATGRTGAWPACATWSRSSGPRASARSSAERARFDLVPAGRGADPPLPGRPRRASTPRSRTGYFYVGCSVPVGRMHGHRAGRGGPPGRDLRRRHRPGRHRPEHHLHRGATATGSTPCWPRTCWSEYSPFPGPVQPRAWSPAPAPSSAATPSSRPRSGPSSGPGSSTSSWPASRWAPRRSPARTRRRARTPASSACTSRAARPAAPSPRSPTSGSGATSPTWATTWPRRSTSGMGGSLGRRRRLHRLGRGRPAGQRRARRPAPGGPPLPGRAPARRALPQLGPPGPERRAAGHAGRRGHRHAGADRDGPGATS